MTSGTITINTCNTQVSSNSTGSFNTTGGGKYLSKTWSGSDSLHKESRPARLRRTYTTLDRKTGKPVKRYFYDRVPARAGRLLPNPYAMSLVDNDSNRWTHKEWSNAYGWLITTNFTTNGGYIPSELPPWGPTDDYKLLGKLREKVQGSDFNLGVMLGEGRETLQMIGDTAIKVAQALHHLRRGNAFEAVRVMAKSAKEAEAFTKRVPKHMRGAEFRNTSVQKLGSNWLELNWGWIPLISDVQEGSVMLAHQLNVPFTNRYVVRHSVKRIGKQQCFSVPTFNGLDGDIRAIRSKQIVAYIQEKPSFLQTLGLLNPELIAWELTPLSALADYVIPFGEYLKARAFASSLGGTFVQTTREERSWRGLVGVTYDNGYPYSGFCAVDGAVYRAKNLTVQRTITTSLNVPLPRVQTLDKVASWRHCVNSLALLSVMAGSKRFEGYDPRITRTTVGNRLPEPYWNT